MSRTLDMLHRVDAALDIGGGKWTDADRVNITPEGRRKLAELHAQELMEAYGVSELLQAVVIAVAEDPECADSWRKVRESADKIIAEGADGYVGDGEHMYEYCRMLVASMSARKSGHPLDDVERLNSACADYLARHLRPTEDYAPSITDTKARVMAGCKVHLKDAQFDAWLQDIDVLSAKCARHEYTRAEALQVRAELYKVCDEWARAADDVQTQLLVERVRAEFDKLATATERHAMGPAHLEALEHQWRAYKFNSSIAPRIRDNAIGALQSYSITALKAADTFCWAPQTTQAVMAATDGLPQECGPTVSALGDIAQVGRAGWWWFQEPVAVQTTDRPGEERPVVALLWRYGLQSVSPPPDFPQLQREPRVGLWLSTFVMERLPFNGRQQDVCIPTTAWIWHDGVSLAQLPTRLTTEYDSIYAEGKHGKEFADPKTTVEASLVFSRFFMAAAAWLRQKIVVESAGQGVRQAARQLQRQHKLEQTPRVRIVELRRSQYVKREDAPQAEGGSGRKLSVRFVVKGFWRNQWYATRHEHAPKFIESYLKGPADAPLKAAGPTVYVVRR